MKKRIHLPLLLALLSLPMHGQPLSESDARENVLQFLSENSTSSQAKSRDSFSSASLVLSYSSPRLYAYDVEGRFVLASGDRRMPPILGYSDGSSFDKAMESDCFRSLIQHISADYNPNFRIYKPTNVAEYVEPLCNDTWHQQTPYKNMTPEIDGSHCVVGCVATAMSELMYYYKHPYRGTGSYSYNDSTGCGMILSSDFSQHVYDWDHMLPDYGYNGSVEYTEEEANAVALLASDCGISVGMKYSSGSSGAKVIRQPMALVNYFGYDEGMQMYFRNFFTQCEWDSIMFNELNEGRPMLVGGWNPVRAHSYLCDGYDSNGFFHLRFGNPEEDANGYYYFTWSTPLQPEWYDINQAERGFNLLQSLLVGVKPKTSETASPQHYIYGFSHIDPLTDISSPIRSGDTFSIGVYYLGNIGWNEHYGRVGIALKKAGEGKSTPVSSTRLLYTYDHHFPLEEVEDTTFSDTLHLQLPRSISEGKYKVVPVYEENGEFIEARTMVGTPNFLTLEVSANGLQVYSPKESHSSLRVVSVDFPKDLYRMDMPTYSYTLTNDGAEYSGRVFLGLYQEDKPDVVYMCGQVGVSIGPGEVQTYKFCRTRFNTVPAGEGFHLRMYADIDLFTDSMVVIYDNPDFTIKSIDGYIPTDITTTSVGTASSIRYYDLRGVRHASPLSLPKNSIYIEMDEQGNAIKRIRR